MSSRAAGAAICLMTAVLLAGCRLEAVVDVEVNADGSGTAGWTLIADAALVSDLDALELDPTVELAAAAADSSVWQVERRITSTGALEVRISRPTSDLDDLAAALAELTDGLAAGDPGLHVDLDPEQSDTTTLSGTAWFAPPDNAGMWIDDEPVGPSAQWLADQSDAHVDAALRIRTAGTILSHNADEQDGNVLIWQLRAGQDRAFSVTFEDTQAWPAAASWWAGGIAVVLTGALVVRRMLRRRSS